ncbi:MULTISPECIES: hypothetical protein [unclassified Microcoleus]|jgi:hypothetical protein|uniref:hypothetical protein n=1 Tax=unclassified Microcoleus TaxID=2642155 RepID=UPI00343255E5
MALIRWEPLREMDSLQREMNRLFDSLTPATDRASNGVAFVPAAELDDQEFHRWYPPRDLSVESIPNRKSKILSSPEFIRGVASKI